MRGSSTSDNRRASSVVASLTALVQPAMVAAVQEPLPPPNAVLSETFTALTSVRELSDGRVILTDPREGRIVVADFATGQVRQIGRRGQGPGEYSTAFPLHAIGGDSSVSVSLERRWLLFDGDSIVRTLTVSDAEVQALGRCFAYGFDDRGRMLTRPPCLASDPPPDSNYLALISRGAASSGVRAGHRVDTIGRIRSPPPRRPGSPPSNLRPYEHTLLTPDGWVAVARLDPYRVDWYSPEGQWVRGSPLPVRLDPLDRVQRRAYEDRLGAGQDPDAIDWPASVPPFGVANPLTPTWDGRVLIRRLPTLRSPGVRYDVINRRGELEKHIVLAENERILGFGQSSVYVVVRDEFDLETVRRHPWR